VSEHTCEAQAAVPKLSGAGLVATLLGIGIGGPRCGKPAVYRSLLGYRCEACAELFREAARNPNSVMNLLAGGAPRTEAQIDAMLHRIPTDHGGN
jgi:hypothetical protein